MMATEAARNDALPFDQLVAGTTCSTMSGAPLPHSLLHHDHRAVGQGEAGQSEVHPDLELSRAGRLGDVRAQHIG